MYCCYDSKIEKLDFISKGLNKRTLEDTGNEPMSRYRQLPDETVNLKSTNRGFKTPNYIFETKEKTKKGLGYFYPKREVLNDGMYTKPLNL